jgi:hypothetical protein
MNDLQNKLCLSFSKDKDENIEATFSFEHLNNQVMLSGLFNIYDEERSFRLESCNTAEIEDCYLWMEVKHQERFKSNMFYATVDAA